MIKDFITNNNGKKNYVWFLRQAGRYLPEYRKIRQTENSFLNLCNNIEKATEITLQPIKRFNLDSAIIFSDILIIPYLLEQDIIFKENIGPKLKMLSEEDILRMNSLEIEICKKINTYKIIKKVRKKLNKEKGLIGFCGAPWTVACYMIDGESKLNFPRSQNWIKEKKDLFFRLLDIITNLTIIHLNNQAINGCDTLMLFDSWASIVPEKYFEEIVIKPTMKIRKNIRDDITFISYAKGIKEKNIFYYNEVKPDVLGIDHTQDLSLLIKMLPDNVVLQGNLDPFILREGGQNLVNETEKILKLIKNRKHIFNVGHGIIKDTPIENVETVLKIIRSQSD